MATGGYIERGNTYHSDTPTNQPHSSKERSQQGIQPRGRNKMYNYRPHHREEPAQALALIPANDCTTKCGIHRIDTRNHHYLRTSFWDLSVSSCLIPYMVCVCSVPRRLSKIGIYKKSSPTLKPCQGHRGINASLVLLSSLALFVSPVSFFSPASIRAVCTCHRLD